MLTVYGMLEAVFLGLVDCTITSAEISCFRRLYELFVCTVAHLNSIITPKFFAAIAVQISRDGATVEHRKRKGYLHVNHYISTGDCRRRTLDDIDIVLGSNDDDENHYALWHRHGRGL